MLLVCENMLNKAYKTQHNQYRYKTIAQRYYLRKHPKNKRKKNKCLKSVIIALAYKRLNAEV